MLGLMKTSKDDDEGVKDPADIFVGDPGALQPEI